MLALKKKFQKYFKSIGYFFFFFLYGKIEGIISLENGEGICIDLV
jgi:hypothetical protein